MADNTEEQVFKGKLVGYKNRINFFSNEAVAVVKVYDRVIRIRIDYRQKRFIQNEYPVGSSVNIGYNNHWYIISKPAPDESMPEMGNISLASL